MDIALNVSNWVLEFLLKQPLGDRAVDSLLRALPLPDDKPTLKKLILLKKLESDASHQSVSESTLDVLEVLEEIKFRQGIEEVSDSMKRAYCAVAVECTVRILRNGDDGDTGDDYRRFKFFEKVLRVWRGRIGPMENGGLGSEDLWIWKDEIEAAVWDENVYESIKKKMEEVNAVEAVNDYLREERENLGPTFLEVLADRMKDPDVSRGILGLGTGDQPARKEAPLDSCALNKDVKNEIQREQFHPGNKLVGLGSEVLVSRNSKRAKIVDSDKMTTGPSYKNHNTKFAESISGVARENKCDDPAEADCVEVIFDVAKDSEHHAPVEENHIEAIPGIAPENRCLDPVEGKRDEANLFNVDSIGVVQTTTCGANDKKPKPSTMKPTTSAPAYERGDSIDGPQDDPKDSQARHRSSSPRRNASPLKTHENKILLRRRHRRWSVLEEDTLRKGVEKYGKGNWKYILHVYRDIFQERTDVDLKDKWRNLIRHMN